MIELMEQMAREAFILLKGSEKVVIIGILRRGAPLAEWLVEILVKKYALPNPLRLDLSVKRYADDLTILYPETKLTEEKRMASIDLAGYTILVVDDVLYTGHSLLRVIDYLSKKNPEKIRVACLVDRRANTLPVSADIVGAWVQIAPPDIIECNVPPYEEEFKIELLRLGEVC
jgi:pyrimidine operon attenuation protein/uracil phosphoribosyltransferase